MNKRGQNKPPHVVKQLCDFLIGKNIELLNSKNIREIEYSELKNPNKEITESFQKTYWDFGCKNLNYFFHMAKCILLDKPYSKRKKEKCRIGNKKGSAYDIMTGYRMQLLNNGKINF